MKVLELLDDFQRKVEVTTNFPMTKKVLLERDEIESLISNVQAFLPDEMKHAKWIKEEREKILVEANAERRRWSKKQRKRNG